jgi:hypothetical protein
MLTSVAKSQNWKKKKKDKKNKKTKKDPEWY